MRRIAIAGVQMVLGASNNLDSMRHRLDSLMRMFPWVEMVLFSELAPFGSRRDLAREFPNDAERAFQEMAARQRIWLIPGSMYERKGDDTYNTASVINPQGEIVTRYRKLFPFYPYESGVAQGDSFCVFEVPHVGRFGLCICYDLWFPETARTLTSMGAEVILHPVLTSTIDRDIEIAIAQATGAMFQTYVVDINGLGMGGNGRSCVVDPHGRFLHQSSVNEEVIPLHIDLDIARQSREDGIRGLGQMLKSFRDRHVQFDVYSSRWAGEYLDSLGELEKPKRLVPEPLEENR
ncbi:MAG TPA: carbon-nitrogen hydrolase family protein [Anaerolineae bacterium]|nr:carbon-nitrogen hydrolase family protein [Anaerolineae bacterium]